MYGAPIMDYAGAREDMTRPEAREVLQAYARILGPMTGLGDEGLKRFYAEIVLPEQWTSWFRDKDSTVDHFTSSRSRIPTGMASTMTLPNELICKVIQEVIDMPAVFIFDVITSTLQRSPISETQYRYMSLRPRVNPPGNKTGQEYPGTFESQVSKTIRSLLSTNTWIRAECLKHLQRIKLPDANGQGIVHFNPRKHVICLYRIDNWEFLTHRGDFILRPQDLLAFAKQLTDLDFDIDHVGFMAEGGCVNPEMLALFRTAFPTIHRIYAVVTELPRKNPSQPVDFICPARDSAHTLSPMFLHIARRSWDIIKTDLFFKGRPTSHRGDWEQGFDPEDGFDIEGMVLI
ncbi:26S proteasome regulatory subunit 6B [Diaporthe eres]|uniref:26S proteasome regulatory subunit 6B n=1 Tax=Diaporthe eres TaxID=83184 RepID=A0ABR1P7B9_DIAER